MTVDRPLVEVGHANGIERLDDARPCREAGYELAGTDTAEVGENEIGAGLDEGVGGVDEDHGRSTRASLRATILGSSRRLADEYGISILYITHDLATAYQVSGSRSSGNSITFSARLCDNPDLR